MKRLWRNLILVAALGCSAAAARAQVAMQAGVNLAGLEFGSKMPGKLNYDYIQPNAAELTYYHSKGLNLIRLPVKWERLQPRLFAAEPSPALDAAYLKLIRQVIGWAGARGMTVIVDMHDYGGYSGRKLGSTALPAPLFKAFWTAVASKLAGVRGLAGYDLMNEPSGMPNPASWPQAAQAAVDGIRQVDTAANIYVEGDLYASAGSWSTYNANLAINDPAGHLVYQAHVYGDHDNSGTHWNWASEAALGVSVNTIAQRVGVFASWCQQHGVSCMIGEVGVPSTDPNWNTQLSNGLSAMQSGGMQGFAYWAGGPWWNPSYKLCIEPTAAGDAVQMLVVEAFGAKAALTH